MYKRIGAGPQLSYQYFLYNLSELITHPRHLTTYTRQNLVRGIVQEKISDNRYAVIVPRISDSPVIAKQLVSGEKIKSGDPVWIMFEDNDIMKPIAIKAALDDPIPSVVPLQTLSQVNSSIVPQRIGQELFLNFEGNINLPRETVKSDRLDTTSISLRANIVNLIKRNRVVQKGQLRVQNQVKYKVQASPVTELAISTLNSISDLALRTVSLLTSPIAPLSPVPNVFDIPLQKDKAVAYIPDLQADFFTADTQRELEEELEENIIDQEVLFFDFDKLTDDLEQPILELIDNIDDTIADEVEFFGSRERVQINKKRIIAVFQQLLTNIQSFNAQASFVSSVRSGVIYEPARKLLVRNFRKADLVTRFVELQNSVQYFLVVPDLAAIQDIMSFMTTSQIQQWFQDLNIDISLINSFKTRNNTFDIARDTGLGRDQIEEIIAKLGESAGSAIQVLLLLQKLGNGFVNVVGQYLDSKLINVNNQDLFDLAVIKLFGSENADFSSLDQFNISFTDLIKFITPAIDPRKPISSLAFHAGELLFMDDVFWFESGNVVVSPQMLLEVFSIKNQPKIFVNTDSKYQKNLEIIFNKLLPVLTEDEINDLTLLDLSKLGRSSKDAIEVIDNAVSILTTIVSNLTSDNLHNIIDQLNTNLDTNSNPLLMVLNYVLISLLNNLLHNTTINVNNIKSVFNWYKQRMLLLKQDLKSGKVKLFDIKIGSGFIIEIDDKLTLNRRVSGQINDIAINPRYPDFNLDTSFTPDVQSSMRFSPDVEVQDFKVDEVPLIQISKFRSTPEQPFKYFILFKPTQMEFWIDGDNNVVIRANKVLLEGKDDIIIKSNKNIMMLAGSGILQASGTQNIPESVIQGVLAGNHVVSAANNIMMFSDEQIKQVALARSARKFEKREGEALNKPIIL